MNSIEYRHRLDHLEGLRSDSVLKPLWPAEVASVSFEEALTTCGQDDHASGWIRNVAAARAQLAMLSRPIIAVLGQLNAGKSSVVASFLSQEGRRRLPRGEEDEKGTHRFVYWVPASWLANDSAKAAFFELLDAVHGRQRELLADDPEAAAAQYRSGRDNAEKLGIPLIAGDSALDVVGAALLDCPDVQTHDVGTALASVESRRLEMLVQSAQICSAFLVVWRRAMVRDGLLERMLTDVRQRIPTAPLYLLLNKIEPEPGQPERTRTDATVATLVERFGIVDKGVFGAFHFKIEPLWRELTPPELVANFDANDGGLPQFFQIDADPACNCPDAVSHERFLHALPGQLDPTDLQQRKMADAWAELGRFTGVCVGILRQHMVAQQQQTKNIHTGLLTMCVEMMTESTTGEPMQVPSEEFTKSFDQSLRRTAPWWVRFAMKGSLPVIALGGKLKKLKPFQSLLIELLTRKISLADFRDKFRKASEQLPGRKLDLGKPDTLAEKMKTLRWVPEELAEHQLVKAWEAAIGNFHRFPLEIDSLELDRMTGHIWRTLGFFAKLKFSLKHYLKAVGSLFAVGSLLLAAIDAGFTMFVTMPFTSWLTAIIPGEMLGAAAVGGVAVGGAAVAASLLISALKVNTLPYLSRLFAFTADAFGVPRIVPPDDCIRVEFRIRNKRTSYALPHSGVPVQETICQLAQLRLWEETPTLKEIEKFFIS